MNEVDVSTVVNFVTDLVRAKGRLVGAHIGNELARQFPGFDRGALGFSSLTNFLDRAAPELSIAGQSGSDFIWTTDADLGRIGAHGVLADARRIPRRYGHFNGEPAARDFALAVRAKSAKSVSAALGASDDGLQRRSLAELRESHVDHSLSS